jgi:hypothetical protein
MATGSDWVTEPYQLVTHINWLPTTSWSTRQTTDEEQKVARLFGQPLLAEELYNKGLIFLINQSVLHNYGYAISVAVGEPNEAGIRHVTGIALHRTLDPDGIWLDEETIKLGRRKLRHAWGPLTDEQRLELSAQFNDAFEKRRVRRQEAARREIRLVLDAKYGSGVASLADRLAEVALKAADGER